MDYAVPKNAFHNEEKIPLNDLSDSGGKRERRALFRLFRTVLEVIRVLFGLFRTILGVVQFLRFPKNSIY